MIEISQVWLCGSKWSGEVHSLEDDQLRPVEDPKPCHRPPRRAGGHWGRDPALQSVLEADVIREGLLKEEKDLTSRVESGAASAEESSRLTEVFQSLEAIDSAKAPARAAVILSGEHLP